MTHWEGYLHMLARPLADGAPLLLARGTVLALLCGICLALNGCAAIGVLPPVAIAATIEGVSLNQTGKTGSDHLVSLVSGEDCSMLRYTHGGKYCLTEAEVAQQKANLHRPYDGTCYRLRSGVNCYAQTDETHTSETVVYNP
jgi:hypothetical protein